MRTLLCPIVLLLCLHTSAWARPVDPVLEEGIWYKTSQGCKVWRGKYSPGLIAIWDGWCKDGLVSGYGALEYEFEDNGQHVVSRYEGHMLKGKANGRGELLKPDGTRYVGEFRDGWTHGQGSASYPSGEQYEGEFAGGLPHGQGVMIYPTGERHEGGFVNGAPHGRGQVVYPNGDRYAGHFVAGAAHGHGRYIWQKGNSYEGEFFFGLPHGVGKCFAETRQKGCKFEYGQLIAWL